MAPSPFNGVKLDLAVILVAGVLLWLLHERWAASLPGQLLLLGGYAGAAAAWLVWRTRRVLRAQQGSAGEAPASAPPAPDGGKPDGS